MAAPRTGRSLRYRRVLVKLSGEALMGDNGYGIDVDVLNRIAADVAEAAGLGIKLCLVVGGGNIYRGLAAAADGMDRVSGDYMGMLATVLNGLALGHALESKGRPARVMSAIPHAEHLRVVHPRPRSRPFGRRQGADLRRRHRQPVFHHRHRRGAARRRDGLRRDSSRRPRSTASTMPTRQRTRRRAATTALSYDDVLRQDLRIMDGAAIALARDNRIPIIVFSIKEQGGLAAVLQGKGSSTTIA